MQLTFLGGADSVTGSCALLVDTRIGFRGLVDCGAHAERGPDFADGAPALGFDARALDCVILTHAHRDHCGRLPQLHRAGFRGPVYCTRATAAMARLALLDAARFSHEFDAADVELIDFHALDRREDFRFDRPMRVHGLRLVFHRSTHILGAVAVTLGWRDRRGHARSIAFSGDIGGNTWTNPYQSLLAGQTTPGAADTIVVEATRGAEAVRDPVFKDFDRRIRAWVELFADSDARGGGPVLLPCFAMHRAQELLFDLDVVLRTTAAGEVDATCRPRWLTLDAPLARRMTEVYAELLATADDDRHAAQWRNPELASRLGLPDAAAVDRHLAALWRRVHDNRAPGGTLRALHDRELNRLVALAGSGMAEGGRIVDFIVDQIHRPEATIVLCGYAPPDTGVGRLRQWLADEWPMDRLLALGAARIDPRRVQARIVDFGDYYSGHADIDGLARFVFEPSEDIGDRPARTLINHGDDPARAGLAGVLRARAAAGHASDRRLSDVALAARGRVYELDSPAAVRSSRPTLDTWPARASSIERS